MYECVRNCARPWECKTQFVPLKTSQPNGDDQEKNDQKMTVSHSEACVPRVPWKFAEERFRTGGDTCHRGHI